MSIKNINDIAAEPVKAGTGVSRQVLIGPGEGPHFSLRRFVIEPGGEMPNHTNTVEHEQYVLNGRAEIGLGGRTFTVGKNDAVFIPAGVPHWYRTMGDEPFEFICVVPNEPDKVELVK
ncbi:MAG: cupin domain-containing protein [PVC group bacterium]